MATATPARPETLDVPVLGMHCAACAARIEKALARAPGVSRAGVNFATGRASVAFDPDVTGPDALRAVVRDQGYDAVLPEAGAAAAPDDEAVVARDAEYRRLRTRLVVAAVPTAPV